MLVLSRRVGEAIVIGMSDDGAKITVHTIDLAKKSVRLVIEAPPAWELPNDVVLEREQSIELGPVGNRLGRVTNLEVAYFEFEGVKKTRLGIIAPRTVPVHRLEVYEAIHGQR